jgi:outer membrane protein
MAVAIGCFLVFFDSASAQPAGSVETLAQALAAAYADNPTLNAERAGLRATDEGVPQALSGFRPQLSASASTGVTGLSTSGGDATLYPSGVSLTITQPLFTGGRTVNGVKIAETAVLAGREVLRNTEQTTLLSAVSAFMNLVQAQALLNLQKQNLDFLGQQVNAAKDRLNVGEGTRTDVAQTNASLAAGQASYESAVAALNAAIAVYAQVIGHEPKALGAAKPVENLLSKNLNAALADAMTYHPAILAASYNIDISDFNVKVAEGALLPTLALQGSLSHQEGEGNVLGINGNSASAVASLSVPIFSGGDSSSKVRQAKENLDQARIQLDAARDTVRAQAISAWGTLDAARAEIRSADSETTAQNLVLSGVIEEHKVGQATTLDVLNAQQTLLSARVALVTAQHDRVVASYTLLAAIGKLNAETLGLDVASYDPVQHYTQVRDKWGGLRTPDGR